MSTTVDNRVVEMRFNNRQFEKNANESISTLGKLKKALKFDKTDYSALTDLQKSTKDFNLDSVTNAVDKVSDRFNAMGVVGMTVINRITNAAIDFGKKAMSSMTGGLSQGFDKYSAKMEAVQVMMINSGAELEEINSLLANLQRYTDETSYSFSQMVSAMGQFTAANIEIETAEEMVQGIANWAATAGVNATNAAIAFDVMSKAMGKGYLERQQADRLNAMNMFTPDAKRLLLEVGAAMGEIRKEGERFFVNISTGKKLKEVEVDAGNLVDTLTKGKWATKEVWEEFLHLYNAATDGNEILGLLDDYDRGILEAAGLTEHFGEEAYDAAYVAKTFGDAVGAVRDALSSGWSNTFELIFGNYEEASEIWTGLANTFATIALDAAEARNEIFGVWNDLGGRDLAILTAVEAFHALHSVVAAVKLGFEQVFEGFDGYKLLSITKAINNFVHKLKPSEETFYVISAVSYKVALALSALIDIIKGLLRPLKALLSFVGLLAAAFAGLVINTIELLDSFGLFESILYAIDTVLRNVIKIIITAIASIGNLIDNLKQIETVRFIWEAVTSTIISALTSIPLLIADASTIFAEFIDRITSLQQIGVDQLFNAWAIVSEKLNAALTAVKETLISFFNFITGNKKDLEDTSSLFEKVSNAINDVKEKFSNLGTSLFGLNLEEKIGSINTAFKDFFANLDKGKIAIGAVTAGLTGVTGKLLFDKFKSNSGSDSGVSGLIGGALDKTGLLKKIATLGLMAAAIALIIKKIRDFRVARGEVDETVFSFEKLRNALSKDSITEKVNTLKESFKNFYAELGNGKLIIVGAVAAIAAAGIKIASVINSIKSGGSEISGPASVLFNSVPILKAVASVGLLVGGMTILVKKFKEIQAAKSAADSAAASFDNLGKSGKETGGIFTKLHDDVFGKLIDTVTALKDAFVNLFTNLNAGKVAIISIGVAIAFTLKDILSVIPIAGNGLNSLLNIIPGGKLLKTVAIVGVLGTAISILTEKIKEYREQATLTANASDELDKISDNTADFEESQFRREKSIKKTTGALGLLETAIKKVIGLGDAIRTKLSGVTEGLGKFFGTMTIGKAIAIAFSTAVVGAIASFSIALGGLPILLFSMTRAFMAVGSAINNWSIWGVDTFGDTLVKVGKSLIYFAGAMWLIAEIPADRIKFVGQAVAAFLASMLTITTLSTALAFFGKLDGVWEFGISLAALAASMIFVAGAIKMLADLGLPEIGRGFGVVAASLTAFVVSLYAFSFALDTIGEGIKVLDKTSVSMKTIIQRVVLIAGAILAVAFAIRMLAAVKEEGALESASRAIADVVGALGVLTLIIGKLGVAAKPVVACAATVLAVAYSFKILADSLAVLKDAGLGIEHFAKSWEGIVEVAGVLAVLVALVIGISTWLKAIGKDVMFIGVGALAIALAFKAMLQTLVYVTEVANVLNSLNVTGAAMAIMFIGVALFFAMKGFSDLKLGMEAAKASLALLPVVAVIGTLALVAGALSFLQGEQYGRMLGVVIVFGAVVAGLVAISKLALGVSAKPILAIVGVIIAITTSLMLLSNLVTDLNALKTAATAIGGVMLSVIAALLAVSQIANAGSVQVWAILSMVAAIGAIGAALYFVSKTADSWYELAATGGAIAGGLIALGVAYKFMATSTFKNVDYGALLMLIAALGIIGFTMSKVAQYHWLQIGAVGVGISLALLAFARAYKIILDQFALSSNVDYGSLLALIAALGIIGLSLSSIAKYNWLQIGVASLGMSGALIAFAFAYRIITKSFSMPGRVDRKTLLMVLGALAVIGATLSITSQYNWGQIATTMGAMVITLAAFVGAYAAITNIPTGMVNYPALAMTLLALALVGGSLASIAQYPWEQIVAAMASVSITMLALSGVMAIVSGLGATGGAGAIVGALAFGVLAASLIVLSIAIRKLEGVQFNKVGEGLLILASAIAVVVALSAAFGFVPPLILGLGALAAAFVVFGLAAIEFGYAANLVSSAISTIVDALVRLGTIGPEMAANITNTFIAIGTGIGTGIAMIIVSFTQTLIVGLLTIPVLIAETVAESIPSFIEAGKTIMSSIAQGIYESIPYPLRAVAKGVKDIVGYVRGDAVKEMERAGGDMAVAWETGINNSKSSYSKSGAVMGNAWLEGLGGSIGWGSLGAIDGSHGWGDKSLTASTEEAIRDLGSDNVPVWGSVGASLGDQLGIGFNDKTTEWLDRLGGTISRWVDWANSKFHLNVDFGGFGSDLPDYYTASMTEHYKSLSKEEKARVDAVYAEVEKKKKQEATFKASDSYNAYTQGVSDAQQEAYWKDIYDRDTSEGKKEFWKLWNNRNKPKGSGSGVFSEGDVPGSGGSSGGGGGAAKEAAKEYKPLFDLWKDGGKIIDTFAGKYGIALQTIANKHPINIAEEAVQSLADKLFEVSIQGENEAYKASITTQERLEQMHELFEANYNNMLDTVQNFGDVFGNFTQNASESIDDWMKSLNKQDQAIENWVSNMERLAKRSGSFELFDIFREMGVSEGPRLSKLLALPEKEFQKASEAIIKHSEWSYGEEKELTRRLVAAQAYTVSKAAEQTAETVEETTKESTENVSNTITEGANKAAQSVENAANNTSESVTTATDNYVSASNAATATVLSNTDQIISKNDELVSSTQKSMQLIDEVVYKMRDTYQTVHDSIYDIVSSSQDFFGKVDLEGQEVDKDELIDNAKSNDKLWDEWEEKLSELMYRGLDDRLLMDLANGGLDSLPKIRAVYEMAEDELEQYNMLYERSMQRPEEIASALAESATAAGVLFTEGFVNSFTNDQTAYQAAKNFAIECVRQMNEGIENPEWGISKVSEAMATTTAEGIKANQNVVDTAAIQTMQESSVVWSENAKYQYKKVGEACMIGFTDGITENWYRVVGAFSDVMDSGIQTTEEEADINSPSKVFARIGEYCMLGLANGINQNASYVNAAAQNAGDTAIESMRTVIGHIADIVNGEVQVDPTIRPVMDLSGIDEGMTAIDSAFGGRSYALSRGINIQNNSDSINDMMAQMAARQAAMMQNSNASPINMYVYAAPGQSEQEIADIVEQRFMARINSGRAVWT